MQRSAWEKGIADRRPVQELNPQLFLEGLQKREAAWYRRARFRVGKTASPQMFYTEVPQPLACLVWEGRLQYLCAKPSRAVHLHLADTFGDVEKEHIQVDEGPEALLRKLYHLTTRDPPEVWETPDLFVQQSQGLRLR